MVDGVQPSYIAFIKILFKLNPEPDFVLTEKKIFQCTKFGLKKKHFREGECKF